MRQRFRPLRALAFVLAGALAFAQCALAAFACPMTGTPQAMLQAAEEGGCDMAGGAKTLCAKTCQGEPQKSDTPALDLPPAAVDSGLRVERLENLVALAALPPPPDHRHTTGPPPYQQYGRFLK